jgi:Na+/H+-translocating membrane pyrophosphatase
VNNELQERGNYEEMGKEGRFELVMEISDYIKEGAHSFLMQEYLYCLIFIVGMSIILFFAVDA